jgi:hypothetical protein
LLEICPDLDSDPECRDQEIKAPAEKDPAEKDPAEKGLEDHLRVDQVEAGDRDKVSVLVVLVVLVDPVDPVVQIPKDLDDRTFKSIRLCVLCDSVVDLWPRKFNR